MKRIPWGILAVWLAIVGSTGVMVGCNTTQKTVAYKTLYGLETGATAAYNGYLALVLKGNVKTNDVPKVSHAFNDLQAAILPALDAVQFSTNALAPANLIIMESDFVNLITTVEKK